MQKREGARISWEITETVNFASGRWAMPPGFQNYQERIASSKARWKRLQLSRGEYVPALNNKIESDGFDRSEPVTPDLMARRAKLWAHSIVKQIVKEAPNARIPERSLFHECQSFKRGQPGKPSDDCAPQCRRECLNVRRGGFEAYRSNGYIAQMATLLRRRIEVLEHYPLPEVLQNSLVPDEGFSRGPPFRAFLF
jgi:hypothetical protein